MATLESLGEFLQEQRRAARLTLRQLAAQTGVSNPYLSQIERGLHEPSVRVLKAISEALNVSIETLLARAGLGSDQPHDESDRSVPDTKAAIMADPALTDDQRTSLLAVYQSYVAPH